MKRSITIAFAALLAAGLTGIEQKLELESAYVGDAYQGKSLREIPKTLREATDLMKGSKMLRAAFGDDVTHRGNGACRIVGGGLHQQCHTVRGVALVKHFLVVGRVAPGGAPDGGQQFLANRGAVSTAGASFLAHDPPGKLACRDRLAVPGPCP